MPKRPWPGFRAAAEDELREAGGVLPWKKLRDQVVTRFAASAGGAGGGEELAVLRDRALAELPQAYVSEEDSLVRLPAPPPAADDAADAADAAAPRADAAAAAAEQQLWSAADFRRACDAALTAAGGRLPWVALRDALVGDGLSAAAPPAARRLLRDRALASVPEEYLSRSDRFVRLPPGGRPSCEEDDGAPPPLPGAAAAAAAAAGGAGRRAPPPADEQRSATAGERRPVGGGHSSLRVTGCGDEASFDHELLQAGGALVVVDFSAVWCGACQRIRPEVHELATEMPEVRFLEVDVDTNAAVANRFNVTAMPTFLFFRGGELVGKYDGIDADELTLEILNLK